MDWIFYLLLVSRSSLEILRDFRLGSLSFNILAVVGFVVLAMAAVGALRRQLPLPRLMLGWSVFLVALLPFVAIAAVSFGRPGLVGAREWLRLLTLAAVFLLAYAIASLRDGRRIVELMFLSLPIPLGLAVYQKISDTGFHVSGAHRVHGTLAHPNSFGFFLTFFIGLTFWKYRRTGRLLWLGLLALETVILVWTASLTSFIMVFFLCAWIFIQENRRGRVLISALAVFLAVGVVLDTQARSKSAFLESAAPAQVAKIAAILISETLEDNPENSDIRVSNTLNWRYANWRNLLRLWRTQPVFGFGLQTIGFINPWKDPEDGQGFASHSEFLKYLVEAGVAGFLVYLFFIGWTGTAILDAFSHSRDDRVRSLLWILAGLFAAWQIGGLVDNPVSMTAFQFCFWAALGAAMGEERRFRPFCPRRPVSREERRTGRKDTPKLRRLRP